MSGSRSLKLLAIGAVALGGLAMMPGEASADGWRHRGPGWGHGGWGHGHFRDWRGPPPRAYYAPPPRAYYYVPPRYVYAPPPRPRHWGYGPRHFRH